MQSPKEQKIQTQTERRPELSSGSGKKTKPPFRPLPGQIQPGQTGSPENPSGTISPGSEESVPIDAQIAGELANVLPTLINLAEPAWQPMDEAQMEKIGRPFSLYLQSKGMKALTRPELLMILAGYGYVAQQVKNVRLAWAERKKAKADAADDRRPEGDGKDVPGVVGGQKVEGR